MQPRHVPRTIESAMGHDVFMAMQDERRKAMVKSCEEGGTSYSKRANYDPKLLLKFGKAAIFLSDERILAKSGAIFHFMQNTGKQIYQAMGALVQYKYRKGFPTSLVENLRMKLATDPRFISEFQKQLGDEFIDDLILAMVGGNEVNLFLQGCGLTEIPKSITELRQIKKLHLSGNMISHIPTNAFAGLGNLMELSIGSSSVAFVDSRAHMKVDSKAFSDLPLLTSLDIGTTMPLIIESDSLEGMSSLKALTISDSDQISSALRSVPTIRYLDLIGHFSEAHLTEIGRVSANIKTLSMSSATMTELPDAMPDTLRKLPAVILKDSCQLPDLEYLEYDAFMAFVQAHKADRSGLYPILAGYCMLFNLTQSQALQVAADIRIPARR